MNWTDRIRQVKMALVVGAVAIAAVSLVVSHFLVRDLAHEERVRMEIWAEAMRSMNNADANADLGLVIKVLADNNTIPVVVTDSKGRMQMMRNIDEHRADSAAVAERLARQWQREGHVIPVNIGPANSLYVCYGDSLLLVRLAYYPYVQLGIVMLFVVIAILALLTSKRAEQNKVWVGLSKETAHQLGTPISSLMAWTEILREQYPDDPLIPEMDKDVQRLQLIADRFSKIGSTPERTDVQLSALIANVVEYMNRRTSHQVTITASVPDDITVRVNRQLFEWVLENLMKNAVDAMHGKGTITVTAHAATGTSDSAGNTPVRSTGATYIDVTDTGCGIERKNLKTVFQPGFTTKKRGWGLGLSLARRIVTEYHGGRIYVLCSTPGVGTTFRIELN